MLPVHVEALRRAGVAVRGADLLVTTELPVGAGLSSSAALEVAAAAALADTAGATPSAEQLASAVRVVAAGEAILHPTVTRRLIEEFARRPTPRRRPAMGC